MWRDLWALFKKDCRMLRSGKFFLMAAGFLLLYTAYINWGYVRFMEMTIYDVYLYDPFGTQKTVSEQVHYVSSKEALEAALLNNTSNIGIDASSGEAKFLLYESTRQVDRHRADYAHALLHPVSEYHPEVIGTNTPEEKARKEITCELLFFELIAVGFLGIAAVLFKEKSMGVIRIHAILPLRKNLFLLSKLIIFLCTDLCFAILFTLLNIGLVDGLILLPAILLQTAILSLVMALIGLLCSLLLKDFRRFTLIYLVITLFAATPLFLSANTAIKFDWIGYHPFYHLYMGLKNAYFATPTTSPLYYIGSICAIGSLFLVVQIAFRLEMGKEC